MGHLYPNEEIDLSACELEPLRTLGFIQSNGCLIAFGQDRVVSYFSANATSFLGIEPDRILNRELNQLCSPANLAVLESHLPNLAGGRLERFAWKHLLQTYVAWLHLSGNLFILELENCDASPEELSAAHYDEAAQEFQKIAQEANSIELLAQASADAFARMSGYHRVMIYRFSEDWSGQVIAEHRKPEAEPFMGLHYPASDIPPQARELYTVNLLRVVVDTDSTPTAIVSDPRNPSIDLTHSILRSVSPYHIEYLLNMGVAATMTASLMVNGQLWGLIACHHSKGKPVNPGLRDAALLIAGTLSLCIARLQQRKEDRVKGRRSRQLKALESEMTLPEKMAEDLCFGQNRLEALYEIDSAAIYTDGGLIRIGNAPPADWIHSFSKALLALDQDVFSFSDAAGALGCQPCDEATGGLVLVVRRAPGVLVFCFRAESEYELTWGGDIKKPAIKEQDSQRISPRKSFAAYKQTIRGKSLPWTASDLETAGHLLALLRRLLPEGGSEAASMVARSIERLSVVVPGSSSLLRSLLDAVSGGMSLFLHNRAGLVSPAFASQALLNQFDLDDDGPEFSLPMENFFRNVGLPHDLLEKMHVRPGALEVRIATGRCANRTYQVELKQILEIRTVHGEVVFGVLTFHNTTMQAGLLQASEAARQQAEHASQIKSAFLANMSHEVRTPLNGILGVAHLLRGMGLPPEPNQLVGVIERSGHALLRLVNDILDVSKIEAGKLTLEAVPFDLQELLEDAVRLFRSTARPGVKVVLEVADGVPALLIGDPVRLRQVVMNLLGNAIKFTHEGQVTLRVHRENNPSIYVTLDFRILDTGIGIAQDKIAGLFERFGQADVSTSRKYGGTGLGLAISKQLVALMGGNIEATSLIGKGTSLGFKLAFLVDESLSETLREDVGHRLKQTSSLLSLAGICEEVEAPIEVPGAQASIRVLLVDDNKINRMVATALLTRDGFTVAVARNGIEAVEFSRLFTYDAILMDCQMPEMDGYEATGLIRKREAGGKRTPIIALTANDEDQHRGRCISAGMDDFLAKPVNAERLLKTLRKWVSWPVEAGVIGNG